MYVKTDTDIIDFEIDKLVVCFGFIQDTSIGSPSLT